MAAVRAFQSSITLLKLLGGALLLALLGLLAYGFHGYFSAVSAAPSLAAESDRLIAEKRGPGNLGKGRIDQLLLVEDPGFWNHGGIDLSTAGAGLTTLTQSLGKQIGFDEFRPGIRKIRLMGYAIGLESKLTKQQILALYLDNVWMGRGPDGPIIGFFEASQIVFRRRPADLDQHEFLTLVAVPIAPRLMNIVRPGQELAERTRRIERLVQGSCRPNGLRDVWLEGCSTP